MTNMKAVVIHEAGGPDVLKVEERPVPDVKPGWILVRVRAFGLNRSELFTRQGQSPNVQFPRILGSRLSARLQTLPTAALPRAMLSPRQWAAWAVPSMADMPNTRSCPQAKSRQSGPHSVGPSLARFQKCSKPHGDHYTLRFGSGMAKPCLFAVEQPQSASRPLS